MNIFKAKISKFILCVILTSFFYLNLVLASCGTTYPLPSTIVMTPNDVSRFRFEVQNYIGNNDVSVEYHIGNILPFEILWDYNPPQTLEAGSKINVFGTISSKGAKIGRAHV